MRLTGMNMRPSLSSDVRADLDVRWDSHGDTARVVAIVESTDGRVSFWTSNDACRFDPFALTQASADPIGELSRWVRGVARDETLCACGRAWSRGTCITCRLHAKPGYRCDSVHCAVCC